MFPDPTTITVNSIAKTMPRILTGPLSGTYETTDGAFGLTISHVASTVSGVPRVRSLAKMVEWVVDPEDANRKIPTYISIQIDRPFNPALVSQTRIEQLVAGFKTWLDNTTLGKLFGRES